MVWIASPHCRWSVARRRYVPHSQHGQVRSGRSGVRRLEYSTVRGSGAASQTTVRVTGCWRRTCHTRSLDVETQPWLPPPSPISPVPQLNTAIHAVCPSQALKLTADSSVPGSVTTQLPNYAERRNLWFFLKKKKKKKKLAKAPQTVEVTSMTRHVERYPVKAGIEPRSADLEDRASPLGQRGGHHEIHRKLLSRSRLASFLCVRLHSLYQRNVPLFVFVYLCVTLKLCYLTAVRSILILVGYLASRTPFTEAVKAWNNNSGEGGCGNIPQIMNARLMWPQVCVDSTLLSSDTPTDAAYVLKGQRDLSSGELGSMEEQKLRGNQGTAKQTFQLCHTLNPKAEEDTSRHDTSRTFKRYHEEKAQQAEKTNQPTKQNSTA